MSERRRRPNKVYKVEAVGAEAEAAAAETPETPETPPTDVLDDAAARQRRKEVPPKAEEEAVVEEAPKPVRSTMPPGGIVRLPGVIPEAELAAITPAARQAMAARDIEVRGLTNQLAGVKERIAEQEARKQSAKKRGSNYARAEAELALVGLDVELSKVQEEIDKLHPKGKGSATLALRPESQASAVTDPGRFRQYGYAPGTPEGGELALPSKVPLTQTESGKYIVPHSAETIAGSELKTPRLPPGWEDTDAAHTKALKKINDAIGTNRDEWLKLKTDKQKYEKLFQSTNLRRHQEVVEDLDRQLAEKQRLIEQMGRIRDVTLGAENVRQAAANAVAAKK